MRLRAVDTQAQLVELQAGTSREPIAPGEAEYSGTVASAANARAELNRVKKLFDDKLVPQSNLDRAQAASDEAEANKKRSAQVLEELKRGTRVEALDVARAALAEADARIREAEARIAQLELRAPVDAIVDELVFEIGERPPQGSVVVILASDTTPYANVFVPARAISRVTPGLAAKLTIDGVEGPLDGEFGFVATDAMFTPDYSIDGSRARAAGLSGEGHSHGPARPQSTQRHSCPGQRRAQRRPRGTLRPRRAPVPSAPNRNPPRSKPLSFQRRARHDIHRFRSP